LIEQETLLRELFLLSLRGDSPAYAECLTLLAKLLRNFLRKRLLSLPDEVEDILQDVLLAIHNQRHTYDADLPFTSWAFGIARHKLVDFFRRRSVRGQQVDIEDVADDLTFDEQSAQDAKRDVAALLDELPRKQRDAIQLVKIEGLSVADVADRTGYTETSVRVNVHRGLKTLADRMRVAA
jgi:RNA polymerase sigma-70 factor, ECF subfamily